MKNVILVTGGAGFIGSHFIRYILGENAYDQVVNVDLLTYCGNPANNADVKKDPHYKFYKADIGDYRAMERIIKKERTQTIVNFAAESDNNKAVSSPVDFARTNVLGTAVLLEVARKNRVRRFHHISCYDEKTKAFTREGVKSFDQVKKGDLVLSLNVDTREVEWKPIEEVVVQAYKGEMIEMKTQRVDFLVTPNHRMLVQNTKSKKLAYKEANQVKNEAINKLPKYYQWKGKIDSSFQYGNDLKDFMYIMGIFIGDGHLGYQEKKTINKTGLAKKDYIEKSRNRKGQFSSIGKIGNNDFVISKSWRIFLDVPQEDQCRKRCEFSLDRLGIKWHSHHSKNFSRIYFSSKEFFRVFQQCGKYAKNKEIPRWALDMPFDNLIPLWEGLLDSDGHKRRIFCTSSFKLAHQFMELCVKLNLSPNLKSRYSESMIEGRKIKGLAHYVTCPSKYWRDVRKESIRKVKYDGKIWCLRVKDNKNFLVERNGKTAFCGNTCEVFGQLPLHSKAKFKESSPLLPRTPYNASKASADHIVKSYWYTFGFPVTISHCANNYGTHQFPEKVIPVFTTKAIRNQPLPLFKSSKNKREWIHVLDHCRAIGLILKKGKIGEAYNIGTGLEKSVMELADDILKVLGKLATLKQIIPDRPGHDTRYLLDSSKIRRLGWKPQIAWDRGLKETIEWYVKNPLWWKPLLAKSHSWKGSDFINSR